jgi:hypothetical protein
MVHPHHTAVATPYENMNTSISLNIDFAATPITGTVEDVHGRIHEFVGWLGLSDVLLRLGAQHTGTTANGALSEGRKT